MSDLYTLFVSTQKWDPVSATIRWETDSDWSHAGWKRLSDGYTYSAMADGKGLTWRSPSILDKMFKTQYLELVDSRPGAVDLALAAALNWEGAKYDFADILGIALRKDWSRPKEFICDKVVFCAFAQIGMPLLQHKFIPMEHLTPRDILVSPYLNTAASAA